jgi:hypothetical protein
MKFSLFVLFATLCVLAYASADELTNENETINTRKLPSFPFINLFNHTNFNFANANGVAGNFSSLLFNSSGHHMPSFFNSNQNESDSDQKPHFPGFSDLFNGAFGNLHHNNSKTRLL